MLEIYFRLHQLNYSVGSIFNYLLNDVSEWFIISVHNFHTQTCYTRLHIFSFTHAMFVYGVCAYHIHHNWICLSKRYDNKSLVQMNMQFNEI